MKDLFKKPKLYCVSFIPFSVFCFWSLLATKLRKYLVIFVYVLQGKMGRTEKTQKENHATRVTKTPKTKRQKYGMNETITNNEKSIIIFFIERYKTLSK